MNKILTIFLSVVFLGAGLIDGVALVVNGEPITLLDIDKKMQETKLSRQKSIEVLIEEAIKNQKIKELGISVSEFDVDEKIDQIAATNQTSVQDLIRHIKNQGISEVEYRKKIKEALINERLFINILSGENLSVSQTEINRYYEEHKKEFKASEVVEVIQYVSYSRQDLASLVLNPLLNLDSVSKIEQTIDLSSVSVQLSSLLNSTRQGSFTPIFNIQDRYFTMFIKNKIGKKESLKIFKNKIKDLLMSKMRKKAVEDYFITQKAAADIVYARDLGK